MSQACRVACATERCQEGEYTEGVDPCKSFLTLEHAVKAAVHLMSFLNKRGRIRRATPDEEEGAIVEQCLEATVG